MNTSTPSSPVALVVEDHDAVRRALCDRIHASFSHFELREAGSVTEALKIVESEHIDIVLMDFRLPGTDGVDGTRMVLERSPQIPIVMVSGYDDSSHRSAAREAGVREFVSKRAIGKELIPAIMRLVDCGSSRFPAPSR